MESKNKGKLFEEESRLYKYYINNTVNDNKSVEFLKSLFKLELIDLDKSENQDLLQLFEIIGFDKFFEVVTFFSSKTLKIPKLERIKKLLIIAIAYYQVEILKLSPKEAGKILSEKLGIVNLKQKSIKNLVNKLQRDIDFLTMTSIDKRLSEKD